ncbi:MAG: phosphoglycerate kinase [Candidatus Marinimicrobia bacterium]|nr:phosphoglycerate kinase [Candidatus Neomarinimicrobiota bacterium]
MIDTKSIRNIDAKGKRVLVRVDFNVEFEDGKPKDAYKIRAVKETIDFILSNKGAKIALLSHIGRPKGKRVEELSFSGFCGEIGKILNKKIVFSSDCVGEEVEGKLNNLEEGQVLMLENVRFYMEEFENDDLFASKLAKNFDIYVNDAFSVSHRPHASLVKITEKLPSFFGFNFEQEVEKLSKLRKNYKKPTVAIIGGAKIETKLPVITFFAKNYDSVLLGGRLGIEAESRGLDFTKNVIIPKDYIDDSLDVGPETVSLFKIKIKKAKTIVWNGPLGKFEEEKYAGGTDSILKAIADNDSAYKVAGGGETVQVIEEAGFMKKFDFISTGGGAMLVFLSEGTLVALDSLQNQKLNLKSKK